MIPKKITLNKAQFNQLFTEILKKMEEDFGVVLDLESSGYSGKVKSSAFFGYGKDYAPDMPFGKSINSVANVMLREPAVRAYLEKLYENEQIDPPNFGWYLYKKYNEIKESESVNFTGLSYTQAYFIFLGYTGWSDFVQQHENIAFSLEHFNATNDNTPQSDWTHYIGVYYSFVSYKVKKFYLAINFGDNKEKKQKARSWGFHVTENPSASSLKPIQSYDLQGDAYIKHKHLYVSLSGDPNHPIAGNLQMNVIGMCDMRGGHDIESQQIINCSVQTVSLNGYIVNLEAFLLKTTEEHARNFRQNNVEFFIPTLVPTIDANSESTLQLYLMLQRRNFWIRDQNIVSLRDLKVRNNPVRNYVKRLKGTWRIWNFGLDRGKVIQSRLQIGTVQNGYEVPYATMFYPYIKPEILEDRPSLAEQVVALSVVRDEQGERLCFATYLKGENLSLANYAIFDLLSLGRDEFAEGMFITAGYSRKGIIGGYAVITKETKDRPVEPLEMERKVALKYAQELGLLNMHEGLRNLWRRKLWKRQLGPRDMDSWESHL
jgi:hypothetical protein